MIEKWAAMGRANNEVNGSSMMPTVKCFSEIGFSSARDVIGMTSKAPINVMHKVSNINAQAVPLAEGASLLGFVVGTVVLKRWSSLTS